MRTTKIVQRKDLQRPAWMVVPAKTFHATASLSPGTRSYDFEEFARGSVTGVMPRLSLK
jgi:hypothetical protein